MASIEPDSHKHILNLIDHALQGDEDAISALYNLYKDLLEGAVHKHMGQKLRGKEETIDLIQSVWKDLLSEIHEFENRGPDSFYSWLLTKMIHKIQNKGRYYKREKRNVKREKKISSPGRDTTTDCQFPSQGPTPVQAAMVDEEKEEFKKLLDLLPSDQRKAVVLRMRDEKDFEEIGAIMGKTADAARKHYARGVVKLKSLLQESKERKNRGK